MGFGGGGTGGAIPTPVYNLSAGENLAINEAVMINAADSQIWRATIALGHQVIGIMKRARLVGQSIDFVDIAFVGEVIDGIAGVAIVRGDRLVVGGATGRLAPLNTIVSHSHTALTLGSPSVPDGAATTSIATGGNAGLLRVSNANVGLHSATANVGADSLTCTTSSDNAITYGLVIAKALSTQAGVGSLVKVLIIGH